MSNMETSVHKMSVTAYMSESFSTPSALTLEKRCHEVVYKSDGVLLFLCLFTLNGKSVSLSLVCVKE